MHLYVTFPFALLLLAGCANREGVAPSQNPSLHIISPNSTATAEGGIMQRGLDSWLKEEWTPLTKPASSVAPASNVSHQTMQTESAAVTVPKPEDNSPFTLQKYADKWKVYHENKEKSNEGKSKEASHIEQMKGLPVIGK